MLHLISARATAVGAPTATFYSVLIFYGILESFTVFYGFESSAKLVILNCRIFL